MIPPVLGARGVPSPSERGVRRVPSLGSRPVRAAAWALLGAVLVAVPALAGHPYNRGDWPHWLDVPGHPCRSARQAALYRDARPGTGDWDPEGCKVSAGEWLDVYGGRGVLSDPSLLDVDHLIPLAYAHEHGAADWSRERKARYANFLGYRWHLRSVALRANREKGDAGPATWVPANIADWCQYGQAWATVATIWRLSLPDADRDAIRRLVESC